MTFFAAAAIVGGSLIAANASGNAADTQAGASRDATQAQRDMFERQVQLQEPWRQAGIAGLGRLNTLLGLTPAPAAGGAGMETADQIRARLAPQFGGSPAAPNTLAAGMNPLQARVAAAMPAGFNWAGGTFDSPVEMPQAMQGTQAQPMDSAGLETAVQAEMQRQQAAQTQTAQADPAFGSLMAPAPEFKPFTMADFQADPGYGFRQSEGEKGYQRRQSVGGTLFSGKALKDAMAFNQGLATDEYGKAVGRYNQNQNEIYNRFNTNQTNQFNRLAAITGLGQTATNQVGAAAGQFGQQIGSNIIGAGNAQAAGQVGGANVLNSGIGQGVSMYSQQNMLNRFFPPGGTPYNPGAASPMGDFPIAYYG